MRLPRTVFVLLVLSMTLCPGVAGSAQPNIIFIMADDLGYGDLGCYGQTLIQTPNIDRLAAQGMRFTQAYAGSTVCAPSRGILMTGLHNGHAPVRDNVPHFPSYLKDGDITIAELLKQGGGTLRHGNARNRRQSRTIDSCAGVDRIRRRKSWN